MRQLNLFPDPESKLQNELFHGGQLARGKRKGARPISVRRPLHLVLKSTGRKNLFHHRAALQKLARDYAARFGVTLYGLSVQRDHLHFLIRIHSCESYRRFIRTLTGLAAKALGAGLWKFRPFTRVANWGRDFSGLKKYLEKNEREVRGIQEYTPRKNLYRRYLETG